MATNWRAISLMSTAAVLLLTVVSWTGCSILEWRAARREAVLLQEAGRRFETALDGATANDVAELADAVQAELDLSREQRQRILKDAADRIARLPRELTPDDERELESLLRGVYGDEAVSADERSEIDRFVAARQLVPWEVESFETALRERLRDAHRSQSRAEGLVRQRKLEEACDELVHATEIDPDDALAWANLGAAQMLLGRTTEALASYGRALELDDGNWLARYNLGVAAARGGDLDVALDHFARALATLTDPASPERRAVIRDLLREPALSELREDPRFADLLDGGAVSGR